MTTQRSATGSDSMTPRPNDPRHRERGSLRSSAFRRLVVGCVLAAALGMLLIVPGAGAAPSGVDITAVEGQSFTGDVVSGLVCSVQSATITWGDGTTSAGADDGSGGIQGSHTYAEEGTYSGSVTYTYTPARPCVGSTQTTTFQATVQDSPLTGAGRDFAGTAGQSLSAVVAHVDDANPSGSAGDLSAQITWGDGSTSSGSLSAVAGGGFDVTGTHTYSTAGSYPVNTSITDVGSASTSATSTAQIAAAAAQPPRSTEPPAVSGVPHETDTLTTTNGFWSGSPTGFQYQWLRCATPTGDSCVVVPGASASTYTLVHGDVGSTMRARVRAQNAVGTSLPADSAPTAPVTPLVLTARFTVTPNPTCTGVKVTFDASATQTPNPPIERYRFTEEAGSTYDPLIAFHTPSPGPWVVADGTNPRASEVPSYDIRWDDPFPLVPSFAGLWQATPRTITLTVRDRAGASASSTHTLFFNFFAGAELSNESRANCPRVANGVRGALVLHDVKIKVTNKALAARIRCPTVTDCAGTLQLYRAFSHSRRHVKAVLIGSRTFTVTGRRTATIAAKLTAAGRSLLAHSKPLVAIARLTIITPTGRTIKQSLKVTLIGKTIRR
jgi:hypothetical protein